MANEHEYSLVEALSAVLDWGAEGGHTHGEGWARLQRAVTAVGSEAEARGQLRDLVAVMEAIHAQADPTGTLAHRPAEARLSTIFSLAEGVLFLDGGVVEGQLELELEDGLEEVACG